METIYQNTIYLRSRWKKCDPRASSVIVTPTGNLTSTNVQDALEELQIEIDQSTWWLSRKASVRAATTVAWTFATAFANWSAIDGVTLFTGDRILIKNQSDQTQNGIYIVQASWAPVRSNDANTDAELLQATVLVREWTTLSDTQWTMTANSVAIGTTNITFWQVGWVNFVQSGSNIADNVLTRWDGGAKNIQWSLTNLDDSGKLTLGGTTAPTNTLTLLSSWDGMALYNTADTTTNYERLRMFFASNVAFLGTDRAWSATTRALYIGSSSWSIDWSSGNYARLQFTQNASPIFNFTTSVVANIASVINYSSTLSASSANTVVLNISPVINQSWTAWYTWILINPTESVMGSWSKALLNCQVWGSSRFFVGNTLGTMIGLWTEVPTNTITHSNSSTGVAFYNTADQVTNYERVRMLFSSDAFNIISGNGWSGSARAIHIWVNAPWADSLPSNTRTTWAASTITHSIRSTSSPAVWHIFTVGWNTASSWLEDMIALSAIVWHTWTAWYNAIKVNVVENSLGSWERNLLNLQTSSVTRMAVDNTGRITFDATITAIGTTGNQTINKPAGTVNIAAGGTSVTVTNSLVTTSSIVHAVVRTNDATALIKNVVPWAGSFVINMNAAVTGTTSIGFIVFN